MTKYCNKCNYPIEEGGTFCTECGSDDIRDSEAVEKLSEEPETPAVEPNDAIPEITDEAVSSFGVKSIENLQNSTIKPISNTLVEMPNDQNEETNSTPTPQVEVPAAIQNTHDSNQGSFADVPDFMNTDTAPTDTIAVPKDFQLQDGGSDNDYAQTASAAQATTALEERKKIIKKRKQKKALKRTIIICVSIVALSFLLIFIYSYGRAMGSREESGGPFSSGDINSTGNEDNPVDYSSIFTPQNSFRVGNPSVGYISIPNTWSQIAQPEGSAALQYTDNTSWVVTMMSIATSQYSASDYANNVYSSIKSGGGQNITTGKATIAGYPALTVSAYYPSMGKYLTTWCFESKIGQTHYLAIEGPASSGDTFNVIYSFKAEQ